MRTWTLAAGMLLLAACGGGGGGGGGTTPASPVSVTVTGPAGPLAPGATAQYTAMVTGTSNTAVTWSVDPIGPVNVGTISAGGLYTAPGVTGTFTVRATSQADPTRSGTATITVTAPALTVTVNPPTASLVVGSTLLLSATVAGSTEPKVTWETSGGSVNPATASTTTTFTAPGTPGAVTVTARSVGDPTKTGTATLTVTAAGTLTLSPSILAIVPGGTQQFSASLGGTPTTAVTWSLVEGAVAGTVSGTGLYTAGSTVGTYTLKATLVADGSRTATVQVTVATAVSVQVIPGALTLTSGDAGNPLVDVQPSGVLRAVTWSLQEGAAAGILSTDFGVPVYLPPAVGGPTTYHLVATSVADPSKSSTAAITVNPAQGAAPAPVLPAALAASRVKHSAVALADGRILVTGGASDARNGNNTTQAELYLPASGTFQTLPNPSVQARNDHTATLLNDGRVLLAGGDTGYDSPDRASAEVFDPAAGTFTATANLMSALRGSGHRALRLESGPHAGKVLVMGGSPYYYLADATASADLYNPATNTFAPAPSPMQDPRTQFTLTRLQDGRYLITGGSKSANETTLATAEIFNPADMTFTRTTGNMTRGRRWHSATLLASGKVLIAGGYDGEDRAELFDPATGLFTEIPARMKEGRAWHSATLRPDGKVRLAGGRNTYFYRVLGSTEVYDPVANTFAYAQRLAVPREEHTATVLAAGPDAGKTLVLGGSNGNAKASAELLD